MGGERKFPAARFRKGEKVWNTITNKPITVVGSFTSQNGSRLRYYWVYGGSGSCIEEHAVRKLTKEEKEAFSTGEKK